MPLAESLRDPLDDNSLGAQWSNWGGGQVSETGGYLQMTSTLGAAYYGIDSAGGAIYDLTGSYAGCGVADAGNMSGTIASWEVYPINALIDGSNQLFWLIIPGSPATVKAYKKVGGTSTPIFSDTYSASTHRFFRIRERAGTTYWEYSADGRAYITAVSQPNPIAVTALVLDVLVGTWAAEASTTTAKFFNFNYRTVIARTPGLRPRPFAPGLAR